VFVRRRLELYLADKKVVVLCPVPWNPLFRKFRKAPKTGWVDAYGMKVYYSRYLIIPKFPFLNPLAIFLSLRRILRETAREGRVRTMDVHFAYPDGCVGLLARKFLGIRYNVTVRGSDIYLFHKMFGIGYLVGAGLRGAEKVIAVSKALGEFVRTRYGIPQPLFVPNGVDTRVFHPSVDREGDRRCLGIDPDAKVILYVGSLKVSKGVRDLVEAFPRVREVYPGAILLLIGDGPLRKVLEGRSTEAIRILGTKGETEVAAYMRSADIFCLPSYSEGCPNVVLEALASGTPVVCSDIGGIRDIIRSDYLGTLFGAGRTAEIAERLLDALDKQWDRAAIAAYGASFSWARTYEILRTLEAEEQA